MNSSKKSSKVVRLTPGMLRSLIEETVSKGFGDAEDVADRADDTEEVHPDDLADTVTGAVDWHKANHLEEGETLDEHISLMRAWKLEEARLTRRLATIRKALSEGAKKLVSARVV